MNIRKEHGFALIATLLMMSVILAMLSAYSVMTQNEQINSRMSARSTSGFYTAEAGLNLRAEEIRQTFVGFNRPSGASPTSTSPCVGGNQGSGDFLCKSFTFGDVQKTKTYIEEAAGNPTILTIPPGERYQYLNAQEYRYTAYSDASNNLGQTEARLELHFKSRLVPLFQFAAFYDKDLEILPGPSMTLAGPVHTNGDLYLNTDNASPGLTISGQVTAVGDIYRGRKNDSTCTSNPVRIYNPSTPTSLIPTCPSRTITTQTHLNPFNGMIQRKVPVVTVPPPEEFDPTEGAFYWDKADLRLALHLNSSNTPVTTTVSTGIEVRNTDNSVDSAASTTLRACTGSLVKRNAPVGDNVLSAVGTSYSFRNNRENKLIRMLEIDLLALMNCLKNSNWFGTGKQLSDSTEGGLVFYFTVDGPNTSSAANPYGIRVRNGARIYSNVAGAPNVLGLSVISDQAAYVLGNYNSTNKIPAAIMSDSLNVLSNNWNVNSEPNSSSALWTATATTVNAAVLSGTDTTGNVEGSGGQGGAYNGGLENYPRFHENWSNITFTYVGSFVSLGRPDHANGSWVYGSPRYTAPTRAWAYDTSFNNAANLPPITPRFVYLRQELFVRNYTNS